MKYIALLRGINVSGQKKIKMAELRQQLELHGFKQVKTYIQSGNILFEAAEASADDLAKEIKGLIQSHYGYKVSVFVLSPDQLAAIIQHNPFVPQHNDMLNRVFGAVLSSEVDQSSLDDLKKYMAQDDKMYAHQQYLYFVVPNGMGKSKLTNNVIERVLKAKATTRNWNTMLKLEALLSEMD